MQADREFAAQVAAEQGPRRTAVWTRWFTVGGKQIVSGQVVTGAEAITELMAPAFDDPDYTLSWEPDLAQASIDGTLGWTSGRYVSRSAGPEGPEEKYGRYLTLWQRLPDGSWRVSLDTGVPD